MQDKMRPNAMGLNAAAKMVQEIEKKTTVKNNGGLVFGKVLSTSPLSVSVDNRLTVGASNLIISPFCIETKLDIKHTHKSKSGGSGSPIESSKAFTPEDKVDIEGREVLLEHSHTITVPAPTIEIEEAFKEPVTLWRGLSAGDTVIMMVSSDKQTYYVLQRAGGISQ